MRSKLLTAVLLGLVVGGCGKKEAEQAQATGSTAPGMTVTIDTPDNSGAAAGSDADAIRYSFVRNCAACHGPDGRGVPKQGISLRGSRFVAEHSDDELLSHVVNGRAATDPANRSGIAMPPRAGNPLLSDAQIRDALVYLRDIQKQARQAGEPMDPATPAVPPKPQLGTAALPTAPTSLH